MMNVISEKFNSQARQDEFVLDVLDRKLNGTFLEIGTQDPVHTNNTFLLENKYDWRGIMVEYNEMYEKSYESMRKSYYIIQDARKINYLDAFNKTNMPSTVDYLQIDLDVDNGSTINTLKLLDETIFNKYTFSVVTFEHDIYTGNFFDTRLSSREIFKNNGYILFIQDRKIDDQPFEDWYIHSSLYNILSESKIDDLLEKYQN